jgi:hypothetical protein
MILTFSSLDSSRLAFFHCYYFLPRVLQIGTQPFRFMCLDASQQDARTAAAHSLSPSRELRVLVAGVAGNFCLSVPLDWTTLLTRIRSSESSTVR